MITIDPLDDEVIQKKKPERLRTPHERRSASADIDYETKRRSRLVELALRALGVLRGEKDEEGNNG